MTTGSKKYWYPYVVIAIIINLLGVGLGVLLWKGQPKFKEIPLKVSFVDYQAISKGDNGTGGTGVPEIAMPKVQNNIPKANSEEVEEVLSKVERAEIKDFVKTKKSEILPSENLNGEKVSKEKDHGEATSKSQKVSGKVNGTGQNASRGGSGSGVKDLNGLEGMPGINKNGDGSFTAGAQVRVKYTILKEAVPHYPEEARAVDYNRQVVAEALILVGLNGAVEQVEILNTMPNLGFKQEAQRALMKMKFAPIYINGINVKKYFRRNLLFTP